MRHVVFAAGLAAAACAAQAQTLKPQLLPGLWEEEVQVLINGKDLKAAIREAQAAMLASVPQEQRKQVEAMMKQQSDPTEKTIECLAPKDVAEMADPARALAKSMKDAPNCTAQVISVSGGTFRFKSQCKDPDGFSGEFDGEYTVVDAKRWTYAMQGRGKVAGKAGSTPPDGGIVEMKNTGQARWVSADCGSVKPAR